MKFYKWLFLLSIFLIFADEPQTIYDETSVPDYTLPDPLVTLDGTPVKSVQDWESKRRPEILSLFEEQVYGKAPEFSDELRYEILDQSDNALNGKAVRKQVRIYLGENDTPCIDLLIYYPADAGSPVPGFVGANFQGNHTIAKDPAILVTQSWVRNNENLGISDHQATAKNRGSSAGRWPVEKIIDRGYMVATYYYGDVDPDYNDFSNGIHPLFYTKGQSRPAANEWGAISAWAWGLSRCMDYFELDDAIDENKIAVMGHSRLGKTSLWAGATDQRFAAVISNNSGCGGAALSRRGFGETVARINTVFPHWFCDNFKMYNNNESALPVDQHMLIALAAPRPVYITSAVEDRWADPKGEFLSGYYASPVYQLYGLAGLAAKEQPEIEQPVMSIIGYHIRNGKHNVTDYDWDRFMDFTDKYLAP